MRRNLNQKRKTKDMKNKTTALIFSILLGGLGIDRFYFGYTGIGILKLLTGGCFGVWRFVYYRYRVYCYRKAFTRRRFPL